MSAILRLPSEPAARLAELGAAAVRIAGPGHWVHPPEHLHITLRTLEAHSTRPMRGDGRIEDYGTALYKACRDFGAVDITFGAVVVHPKGVMVVARDRSPTGLTQLRRRYIAELDARGVPHYETRTDRDWWHCNVMHFAAPVSQPDRLVEWGRAHDETPPSAARLDEVALVRWRMRDGRIAPETLRTVRLTSD